MPEHRARAATSFDHATLPKSEQRLGTYLFDSLYNRKDPSGSRTPQHLKVAQPHHLLDDDDLLYATSHSPRTPQSLPELPQTPVINLSPMKVSTAFEFRRKGQCAGDIGWGSNVVNSRETEQYGRVDGLAGVYADLQKRHQFMRLSGDPGFMNRAGKAIQFTGSQRKPAFIPVRK